VEHRAASQKVAAVEAVGEAEVAPRGVLEAGEEERLAEPVARRVSQGRGVLNGGMTLHPRSAYRRCYPSSRGQSMRPYGRRWEPCPCHSHLHTPLHYPMLLGVDGVRVARLAAEAVAREFVVLGPVELPKE
jgi:hypothetical protein